MMSSRKDLSETRQGTGQNKWLSVQAQEISALEDVVNALKCENTHLKLAIEDLVRTNVEKSSCSVCSECEGRDISARLQSLELQLYTARCELSARNAEVHRLELVLKEKNDCEAHFLPEIAALESINRELLNEREQLMHDIEIFRHADIVSASKDIKGDHSDDKSSLTLLSLRARVRQLEEDKSHMAAIIGGDRTSFGVMFGDNWEDAGSNGACFVSSKFISNLICEKSDGENVNCNVLGDWVPSSTLEVTENFRLTYAPTVPSDVFVELVTRLNFAFRRRESRRMARVQALYNDRLREMERNFCHRLPYEAVVKSQEASRLKKQLGIIRSEKNWGQQSAEIGRLFDTSLNTIEELSGMVEQLKQENYEYKKILEARGGVDTMPNYVTSANLSDEEYSSDSLRSAFMRGCAWMENRSVKVVSQLQLFILAAVEEWATIHDDISSRKFLSRSELTTQRNKQRDLKDDVVLRTKSCIEDIRQVLEGAVDACMEIDDWKLAASLDGTVPNSTFKDDNDKRGNHFKSSNTSSPTGSMPRSESVRSRPLSTNSIPSSLASAVVLDQRRG